MSSKELPMKIARYYQRIEKKLSKFWNLVPTTTSSQNLKLLFFLILAVFFPSSLFYLWTAAAHSAKRKDCSLCPVGDETDCGQSKGENR